MTKQVPHSNTWVADQGLTYWLEKDERSVPAMLRGAGDGREKVYAKFEEIVRLKNLQADQDTVDHAYHQYVRKFEEKRRKREERLPTFSRMLNRFFMLASYRIAPFICALWIMQHL